MSAASPELRSPLTGLFGRRNQVHLPGRCDGCGKQVELTAYDAREWVCLGRVPLIPLAAYRVFDECPNCRRARRLGRREYEAWVAEEVAGAAHALAQDPDNLELRLKLAWQWYALGRFESALALVSVVMLDTPLAEVCHFAGLLLAGLDRPQEAADLLTKAVEQDPDEPRYRLELARCLMRRRSALALAEHHLTDAHRLAPDDVEVAVTLATVQAWRGEWKLAHRTWQGCERLDPHGPWRTRHAALIAKAAVEANITPT